MRRSARWASVVVAVAALVTGAAACSADVEVSTADTEAPGPAVDDGTEADAEGDVEGEAATGDEAEDATGDEDDADGEDGEDEVVGPAQQLCVSDGLDLDFDEVTDLLTDTSVGSRARWVEVVRVLIECVPDLDEYEPFVADFTEGLNTGLGSTGSIDDAEGACLLRYILDNAADPATALAQPDEADFELVREGAVACFDEETAALVIGVPGSGPQAYGDDASLDELYDLCEAGGDVACDLLYYAAPVDSEYEAIGLTCGGRSDVPAYCVEGIVADTDGWIDASSPALPGMISACEEGDMLICDLLFHASPIGSEHEHVGFTCGGRAALGAPGDCRRQFG